MTERTPALLTTGGAVAVAAALTLIALAENTVAPWAPFHLLHAALATGLPFVAGTCLITPLPSLRLRTWLLLPLLAILLQALGGVWTALAAPALLGPGAELAPALERMFAAGAELRGMSPRTLGTLYVVFVAVWAGVGEEVFYRGYLHGLLRARHGFGLAAGVSAFFFGIRHAAQLALLWPDYPWAAAASWVLFAAFFGVAMSLLFEKTDSLWPAIIVHTLFNLIALAGFLAAPAG